ncbi:glycerophosphodiester phosphodiesterase [Mesorhizobium sp. M7A.F.Ca.CA.001.12.2.1]|uniref:glycerophosphodiester phosphodiesterase family protein n=1 Tax=unclassified Mesorhizobium TaxID=325217 RepID=UPI000FCA7C31|nr:MULTISPECIES: glycerophosphodiester phosphodiesterase family protein [unclassified Mesorhizobium]RUY98196.1 glycerophosphodiester phosphodiesterase [Mesorhizobium sp. M7A.F.Ca.CA.001.12.2.1]RUZ18001.1 glycerophosphodiester phosphodiesterase [Mesorhizobium sp. M7A.F.Ca.US.007.01.2.1]RUZ47151.1 glycerophosphodiester phosphodiesterase [Mesorhizobium sp. M7A.F.Ca.US.003.02.1.1]RUZ89178.1 glycerophosphodiester phosphodiesterase [Mesorhizobium sp. M7A.F.Ca.US.003.02.2.1]
MRKRTIFFGIIVVAAAGIWLNNTSLLSSRPAGKPEVLAHRGLAQDYAREGMTGETCTASRMLPPRHAYLENTIPSMEAAFALGADALELDVHPTTDGNFAVFHDWTLDCRTEGKGETRNHSMAELKTLDVGYGYTADSGKTFPFRGKGIGMMPSLDEVLAHFPARRFNINVKSNDPGEGEKLAARLAMLSPNERFYLSVYGGDKPIAAVKAALPDMHTLSRASLTQCILRYAALGWSGYVPDACRKGTLLIPVNIAKWMWGWPNRFLDRMQGVDSRVYLLGPYTGGDFSQGLDDPELIKQLPNGYSGGISTDALDLVMPDIKERFTQPAQSTP